MDKILLSQQAGRVTAYIFEEKPSDLMPFKGDFPIVPDWRTEEFYKQIHSHMYLEECPEWVQTAVIRGEKIYTMEKYFRQYLKDNKIENSFDDMSSSDKATHLVKFLDANCLGLERLRV